MYLDIYGSCRESVAMAWLREPRGAVLGDEALERTVSAPRPFPSPLSVRMNRHKAAEERCCAMSLLRLRHPAILGLRFVCVSIAASSRRA